MPRSSKISTHVEEWRAKVFVQRHRVMRGATLICEGTEIRAFVRRDSENPDRLRAIPIPEDIRALCESGALSFPHDNDRRPHESLDTTRPGLGRGVRRRRRPADITIGVSITLTGPTSALGIPTKNGIALWPSDDRRREAQRHRPR